MTTQDQKPTLSFIGPGLVGSALARALSHNGYTITGFFSRRHPDAFQNKEQITGGRVQGLPSVHTQPGDILFITTPDEVVESVARKLAESGIRWSGKSVVHCSGSLMSDKLSALKKKGAAIASFHPIQTFADDAGESLFRDITVSIEGDEVLSYQLKSLAESLNARPVLLSGHQKRMLHIAAVFMSNYTVALAGIADQIIKECTDGGDYRMLDPLLLQTAGNITNKGLTGALTGPVARGDVETVRDHLMLLSSNSDLKELYKLLGNHLLKILPDNNSISVEQVNRMRELFQGGDRKQ